MPFVLFVFFCYFFFASLNMSTFYDLLTSILQKEEKVSLHGSYTLLLQYLCREQILLCNSSETLQKYLLKLFFLSFILKTMQFNLNCFFFLHSSCFVQKLYYFIRKNIQLFSRTSFWNLSWQEISSSMSSIKNVYHN